MNSSPTADVAHRLEQPHDLQRRGPARPRQPRAVDGVQPRALAVRELLDDPGAGGGASFAAEMGAEQLDQHLGEEVVGVDVGEVDDRAHRRRFDRGDRARALGRFFGRLAEGDLGTDRDAGAAQARDQLAGGELGRVGGKAVAVRVGEARIEVEPGERADFAAGRVAGVGDPAQAVEDRVVGVEAARHLGQPDTPSKLGLQRVEVRPQAAVEGVVERRAAEGRVAAALQVEVAVQDAVLVERPVGDDLGRDPRVGMEAGEDGRGREQLHVRGERALAPGGPRTDGLSGLGVDHEEAAGLAAPTHQARPQGLAELAASALLRSRSGEEEPQGAGEV